MKKPFWISWYGLTNPEGAWPWEYHGPWWITGESPDCNGYCTIPTICAAVMADDESDAKDVILRCHDDPPKELPWRFVEEKPSDWDPKANTSGRFPPDDWMQWPWPKLQERMTPSPSTRIREAAYERGELTEVLDDLDARVIALESQVSSELDSVCPRDAAADIVRPTVNQLEQPKEPSNESRRRDCWLLVAGDGVNEAFYAQRPEWPGMSALGWTEHHLVELLDGEVVLSREQAERIGRWIEFARGEGAPVEPSDMRALGVDVKP
jgi:hypothetical protein